MAVLVLGITSVAAASAHPLGNFTTNTATGLRVTPDALVIDRILDLAELPALQAIQAGDTDGDGALTGADGDAFAEGTCAQLRDSLAVTIDGQQIALAEAGPPALSFPPGEAGLDTLRLECPTVGAFPNDGGTPQVTVTDSAFPDRQGWREITAVGDGVTLVDSDVPQSSESARLTTYPEARIASPIDQREARLTVAPGGSSQALDDVATGLPPTTGLPEPVARGIDRVSTAFTGLVAVERLTLPFALLAVLVAAALGTLHAFAPGHGKTVIAAYLVGRQGTTRDALLLGGTVAVTHTLGVFLLGAVLSATTTASPERLYPWLGTISGMLFAAVGVALLRQARRTGGHLHGPGGHVHGPDGRIILVPPETGSVTGTTERVTADHEPQAVPVATEAGHEPAPAHLGRGSPHVTAHPHPAHDGPPGHHQHDGSVASVSATARQSTWRSLLVPGLAGGLVPSPSALLVLLAGFAIGRAWFGVGLVVAYGVGMAATLVGAGYLMLRLRGRFDRATADGTRWPRLISLGRHLPVLTSSLIIAGGLIIVVRSLTLLG